MHYTWTCFNVFTVHVLLFGNDALHYVCKCEHMPVWISVLISLDSLKCFFKLMCGLYSSKLKKCLIITHSKMRSQEVVKQRSRTFSWMATSNTVPVKIMSNPHAEFDIHPVMLRNRFILISLVSGIYYILLQKWSKILIIIQSHHTLQVLTNYTDGFKFWALFYIFL